MKQILKIRKDTVNKAKAKRFLDMNMQQFMGVLGVRGEGKSKLMEGLAYRYWKAGYTILDLWAAPNYENYFWCMSEDGHKAKIPITIIAPESLIEQKDAVDEYNSTQMTRYPLVRIVRVPTPTAKENSEQNRRIFDIFTDEIIRCRSERRILTFNSRIFPDETSMFRTLEILFRGVDKIAYNNFHALTPEDLGLKKRSEMSIQMKNYHKILFLAREFGELAPASMKGDKSGQSTLIKKAELKLFRLARHASVSGFIDYQNASDVVQSIRNQIDIWAVKGWTRELAGEHFQWIFDRIEAKRKKILEKYRYSKQGRMIADSAFPDIEEMHYTWYYGFNSLKRPKLYPVPISPTKHKEPEEKWDKLTKIPLIHDESLIRQNKSTPDKVSRADERQLFDLLQELKIKHKWKEIKEKLIKMQDSGEINSNLKFSDISENQLSSKFCKLKTKYTKD